jgi:hypothetical protein
MVKILLHYGGKVSFTFRYTQPIITKINQNFKLKRPITLLVPNHIVYKAEENRLKRLFELYHIVLISKIVNYFLFYIYDYL